MTEFITTHWFVDITSGVYVADADDVETLLGCAKGDWFGVCFRDGSAGFYFSDPDDILPLKLRYPECELYDETIVWDNDYKPPLGPFRWQELVGHKYP